ncbi:MAG: hypothetical protein QME51_04725 [Planctomycetota bacterium]|nr:hypothetical protein [Planctomycetota bacterium]MDI6787654.1 hypothetical protein [Planctomycetota bacterium]
MKYRTFTTFFLIVVFILILLVINVRIISASLVTKERVEATLYEIFGEKISVGEIVFNLWRGVKVTNITLPLKDRNYDFLRVNTIRIIYDQTKLIKGQVVINKIVLYNPEISIINRQFPSLRLSSHGSHSPTIVLKNASITIADNKIFKEKVTLNLTGTNINLYPFIEKRYLIEGAFNSTGLGRWKITGEIDTESLNTSINFVSQNTDIGAPFSELLSREYYEIWQGYQPEGKVDVNISLKLERNKPADITVTMNCINNKMTFMQFPYALSQIEGKIEFTLNGASLRNLKGKSGPMTVIANGYIDGYEISGGIDLMLKIQNMPLDNKLYDALPKQFNSIWHEISPQGNCHSEVFISKNRGEREKIHYHTKIYCDGIKLKPSSFPLPLSDITGEIEILDHIIKLKSIRTSHNKGEVKVNGELSIPDGNEIQTLSIDIDARNIETNDYALRDAFKKVFGDADDFWSKTQPEGQVAINVNLQKDKANQIIRVRSLVQLNDIAIKVGPSFLPLSKIKGQIEYHNQHSLSQNHYISLQNLSGSYQNTSFELNGNISSSAIDSVSIPQTSLNLKVSSLILNHNELYVLLPSFLREFLEQIKPSGLADVSLKITNQDTDIHTPGIRYGGEIKLLDCALHSGIDIRSIRGVLIIKGFNPASNPADKKSAGYLAGSGRFSSVQVESKTINNLSAQFMQEKDRISFYDIKGNAYSGAVSGFFILSQLHTSSADSPLQYEHYGKIEFAGIDIKELGRDIDSLKNREISGKLSAELNWNGKNTLDDLNMQGKASLINAQIWEVPVFLSIYDLFTLTEKPVFHEGEIKFTTDKGKMQIRRLLLISKNVILKGAGKVKLSDGALDIQFDTQFFDIKIPILDKIKNLFMSGIYTVKVGGTFSKPKAEIKPLPILDIFK